MMDEIQESYYANDDEITFLKRDIVTEGLSFLSMWLVCLSLSIELIVFNASPAMFVPILSVAAIVMAICFFALCKDCLKVAKLKRENFKTLLLISYVTLLQVEISFGEKI
jgi:cell division protein FtsW (lipid II flippase)